MAGVGVGVGVEVKKGPSDKRQYHLLHLQNGLSALLIHDPDIPHSHAYTDDQGRPGGVDSEEEGEDTSEEEDSEEDSEEENESSRGHLHCDHSNGECVEASNENEEELGHDHKSGGAATKKAAAALSVGVGSFSDPKDAQGLAHFLEHMLFMGNSKFPDENEYDNFLSKHGGSSNAFTETEFTCYHFDVSSRFLKPALDRFSQFFISPLVKSEAMEREVQAVHSEFDQVLQSDGCRLQQLRSHTADASHPFHSFSWGNRKSLCEPISRGVDMRSKLLDMYKEHYLAGQMKLCVLGGEPLDTLKAWVVELFGEVQEGGHKKLYFPLERALWEAGKIYWVEAVKEQHYLSLTWILPCLEAAYLKKPQDYISHLIGHEGVGSLLSLLKEKGWATGLSAGVGDGGFERNTAAYMFNVSIDLTVSGLSKVLDVIGLLHQYLKMLREMRPQYWVFQELQSMGNMEFTFAEEESSDDYVVHLAMNMHIYADRHIIYGDYAFDDWDPKSIEDVLSYLNPKNMRVDILTKSFDKCAQDVLFEPWFGVPYTVEYISSDLLALWENPSELNPSLLIPEKNEFIPHDFTIHCGKKNCSIDVPFILVDDPAAKVWYKLDQAFKTPRANVYLLLTCKAAQESVKACVATELFIKLVRDALNETLYLANIAKLESSLFVLGDKLELKLFGFNEKLPVLARKIAGVMCNLKPSSERFQVLKEELERVYRNTNMKPMRHSAYLRLQILSKRFFPVDDKLSVLENLSFEDLNLFIPQLLGEAHLEALCHGNILEEEAISIVSIFKDALVVRALSDAVHRDCVLKLPDGLSFAYDANVKNDLEENSVLEMYFQLDQDLGLESVRAHALVDLFEKIVSEPCFNQLRTKEQLGYRVDCSIRVTYRVLGFCFRVQSAKYDPLYLQKRVDAFIAGLRQLLENVEQEEFESYKEALIAEKLEKDPSLIDETDRHWGQILDHRYLFDSRKLEASNIRDLKKGDVLDWYSRFFGESSISRRRLIIHVWGCKMHKESVNEAGNLDVNSCVCVAPQKIEDIKFFKGNTTLQHYTGYRPSELEDCIKALFHLQCNTKNCSLPAIREKYRQHKDSSSCPPLPVRFSSWLPAHPVKTRGSSHGCCNGLRAGSLKASKGLLQAATEILEAPQRWHKKVVPRIGGNPKLRDVAFVAPNGEEMRSKRQLKRYLKANLGTAPLSDFDWSTGETPRRSELSTKTRKSVDGPNAAPPVKRAKKKMPAKKPKEDEEDTEVNPSSTSSHPPGFTSIVLSCFY